jgi:hypothetical protein
LLENGKRSEKECNTMTCQSDYDTKEQAPLRQADECVEEWWDPDSRQIEHGPSEENARSDAIDTAKREALKRGLVKVDAHGEPCMSCPEDPLKERGSE